MPIFVEWFGEPKTTSCWAFQSPWTWDEFAEAQLQFRKLVNSANHEIDIVADMRLAQKPPQDVLSHFRRVQSSIHSNRYRVIMVGGSILVQNLADIFNRIYPNSRTNFIIVDNMEEALNIISQPVQAARTHRPGVT